MLNNEPASTSAQAANANGRQNTDADVHKTYDWFVKIRCDMKARKSEYRCNLCKKNIKTSHS